MAETRDARNEALIKEIQDLTTRLARLEAKCATADKLPSAKDDDLKKETEHDTESKKTHEPWRVKLVTNRRDPSSQSGERKDFEETQAPEPDKLDGQEAASILRLVIYDSKDSGNADGGYGELEILNQRLRELLKGLLAHHPTHDFYGQSVKIRSPYEPLIMNLDLLIEEAKRDPENEEDNIARRGLDQILKLLQQTSGDMQLDDYLKNRESLTKSKSITYDTLWTIFPPGTIVYGRPYFKNDQVFIVQDTEELWPSEKEWFIFCLTYDWDGRVFKRKPIRLGIPRFRGTKSISSLPYYPLSEAKDAEEIKQLLIERGKLYRNFCTAGDGEKRFNYNGVAMADKFGFRGHKENWASAFKRMMMGDPDDEDTEPGPKELIVKGEVMIDFESYYLHGPQFRRIGDLYIGDESDECTCSQCRDNMALAETYHRDFDETTGTGDWADLQFMLCPPRILGYILREKQWAQLYIRYIKPIKDNDSTFKSSLHLKGDSYLSETEMKDLLLDLVKTHGQGQVADLVQDKGKGLVILLYGNPGVGKTSTAETLAAAAGKTLFSIGVGDVGTKAQDVESNLRRIFDLATKWKAILLIDEVDVFVQSRGIGHQGPTTERNALVSVFLRVLEYFQGILILTTNQIALFDVAVQSRIHIAIKYTELDKAQSIAIFVQRLNLYNDKGLVEEYDKIERFGRTDLYKKRLDGRQLRNLLASAMGRAQARQNGTGKMRLDDIEIIISIMTSFKGDLEYQTRRYQEIQQGGR